MGFKTALASLPPAQKRLLAVVLIAGGVTGANKLKSLVRQAQREQKQIVTELDNKGSSKKERIAVDKRFLNRLLTILAICVPSVWSKEALLILIQGGLLLSRTLLTDLISRVEGACGRHLVSQEFEKFGHGVINFAAVGVPAAVVNSSLKYVQKRIQLAFMERLTLNLHKQYTRNRAYYAASTLGGLTHADQRITEDVEKFAFAISELYSHTFKPLLDVILFTRSLSRVMGYKSQLGLYLYFLGAAYLLRAMSPPLAQMVGCESALTGSFRAAHQRLVSFSEEVAYNDPPSGVSEELILNQHLRRLLRYSSLSSFQRCLQQIADGYFVKYFASCVALLLYGAPLYFQPPHLRGSQGKLIQDYIRSMRLLQNTSRGVGDLILVYKRITALASHTSRVAELLEQVKRLSAEDAEHKELFRRNVSTTQLPLCSGEDLLPPARFQGPTIKFHRVALDAPDGTPLVRELSFEVLPGRSVLLMGPNGSGKSSLLRVLAGLWPLQSGEITTPDKSRVFYLSQRPYLVMGTLRDQLLYPDPPRDVWDSATMKERVKFASASGRDVAGHDVDQRLEECLKAMDLEYLLQRGGGKGWEQQQKWNETLSGGEKQRLAMARLLYHRPQFAVLDECTSAVSADGEVRVYEELQRAGITYLSIAHRPALRKYHSTILHFDANLSDGKSGWWMEQLDGANVDGSPQQVDE